MWCTVIHVKCQDRAKTWSASRLVVFCIWRGCSGSVNGMDPPTFLGVTGWMVLLFTETGNSDGELVGQGIRTSV